MLITCRNCNETVEVPEARQPWRYGERAGEEAGTRTVLIIGRDHLLHMCTFRLAEMSGVGQRLASLSSQFPTTSDRNSGCGRNPSEV